ncbi:MAG: sigma-70 family RNA polymerase sigma factor [Blastocatellia bacterium]|nr:sigma-70 family RNA polymerase sigma factor [Blastocatellia bacterium]
MSTAPTPPEEITQLLAAYNNGDHQALEQVFPLVYNELRRLAAGYLRREREDHTLQPTALVHEAYLRLLGQDVDWQNRAHFLGVAAQMMRRILVDHARQHRSEKRGSGGVKIALDEVEAINLSAERAADLIALDDALTALAEFDPQKSRMVELRYFAGLSVEETAKVLGISIATFVRQWKTTRAWLYREITKGDAEHAAAD